MPGTKARADTGNRGVATRFCKERVMRDIDSLVPGFAPALERLPGSSEAYGNLMRALDKGGLSMRNKAEIGLLVAQRVRCDYCIWVMSRLAERRGMSGEDVLFAGMGIARGRR